MAYLNCSKLSFITSRPIPKDSMKLVSLEKVLALMNKCRLHRKWQRSITDALSKSTILTSSQVFIYLSTDLIKRFLGDLQTPIIPYEMFYELMD